MQEKIPPALRVVYEEVNNPRWEKSNIDVLRATWEDYTYRARKTTPGIHVESRGETVYIGELSPGCRACKLGSWDCIFITMKCNLSCSFCYSPHLIPENYTGSVFGETLEQIVENHQKTHITGIGFSGGEPFSKPQLLFDWIAGFNARYPDRYYWLYTNGLLATKSHLQRLGELGLDEIRFNTAATGYDHPTVMRTLAAAGQFIPNVTIEIPVIPDDAEKILSCLATWSKLGVKYLNLHELIYEPGTNAAKMEGARKTIITSDGHYTEIDPESGLWTLKIMQKVQEVGLTLSINDCSLQSKLRQLRGRRRNLSALTITEYEKMIGDEIYESCCAYRSEENYHFFHPDALHEARQRYPEHRFIRMVRTAPLTLNDPGRWLSFEEFDLQ